MQFATPPFGGLTVSNKFYKPATFDDAIYGMVHHGHHSIEVLADMIGWNVSSLYRAANACDEQVNFPAKKLTGAMIAQQDFSPLFHMASRTGHLVIPQPKKRGRMTQDELNELQQHQLNALTALTKFFAGDMTQDDARKAIETAMGSLARGRLAVNHGIKQEELDL